jgi:hypothetical protein
VAAAGSLDEAVEILAASPYGHDVLPGQGMGDAQHAVVGAMLWNQRVLAGWAPRDGVTVLRAMVAWLEIANTVDHLAAIGGRRVPTPYPLGGLGTAWARIRTCISSDELRQVLASSLWGDPGGDSPRAVALSMQMAAADRLLAAVPETEAWVAGGVGLVLARELAAKRGPLPPGCIASAARVVGWPTVEAVGLTDLMTALPRRSAWALSGVTTGDELWRAEARWWRRMERDAVGLTRRSVAGREVLVGTVGVLAADAWRVRAALELAARGGGPEEDLHEVA